VSFQEARRHLGFETHRQWSEMVIRRTTPALLGLFSLVTLFADRQMRGGGSLATSGGLVPQEASHLLRRFGVDAKGAVGRCDFLRVARTERHDKGSKGIRGTTNRGGLLCSLMAKVDLRASADRRVENVSMDNGHPL
jgi:hypothetical protein